MVNCPNCGRRISSESMTLPVEHAGEGCKMVAQNVIELTRSANFLINMDNGVEHQRQAYALIIHAIDEAGKMVQIIREMMIAENDDRDSITLPGFYSHRHKGSEAAAMGLVAVNWFDELLRMRATELKESGEDYSLESYRLHLRTLRENFGRERERVLYVDYENGSWLQPISARDVDIELDIQLLATTAAIVHGCLESKKTFIQIDETIRKVVNSLKELFRGYDDGDGAEEDSEKRP